MAARNGEPIPRQMEAVVLHEVDDWSLETVEVPGLTDVENVVCRVRATTICGSDPKMFAGKLPWPPEYPFIPGHEWAGEVVAVGEDVHRFEPGDRVFSETHSGCGFCTQCRRGNYQLCESFGNNEVGHRQIGHTLNGSFAEYVAVPEDLLYHLDDSISWPAAALIDTNAIALNCTVRGEIDPGDTVAVFGTGIIGLCCVQQAQALGADRVIATGNPRNNELAASLGADHTVAYDADVVSEIYDLTDGTGVDVALEAVGVEESVRQAIEVTREDGTVSLDGMPTEDYFRLPVADIVKREIDVRGCRAHSNLAEASERMVRSGAVELGSLITHEFPLEAFTKAYETFTGGDDLAVRVALRNG
ncbi:zinc-binding dehydrogenase [Saliphagus sp. GCM10025334]